MRSEIGKATPDRITVYGLDLCQDLIGHINLGDMAFLEIRGRLPQHEESRLFNAMLVTLVEHGITPSTLAARLTYLGAPEALQAAVAAGLLGAGSVFLGSMEGAALMLNRALAGSPLDVDLDELAVRLLREQGGKPLPGFGHPLHKKGDPRAGRLLALARECGLYGRHAMLLEALERAVVRERGRYLPINATGAIGALFCDMGFDPRLARGIGVAARAIGVVGHIGEEMRQPMAQAVWQQVERALAASGEEEAQE